MTLLVVAVVVLVVCAVLEVFVLMCIVVCGCGCGCVYDCGHSYILVIATVVLVAVVCSNCWLVFSGCGTATMATVAAIVNQKANESSGASE